MYGLQTFGLLALAASAIAAPVQPRDMVTDVKVFYETKYVTVTEGVYQAQAAPTQPAKQYQGYHQKPHSSRPSKPKTTTVVYSQPAYTPAPQPTSTAPPVQYTTVAPPPPPSSTQAAPAPSGTGYMAVVEEWRGKMGLKQLKQSSKLEGNALNCLQSAPGRMEHKLNPGSMGQVLAPGQPNEFERVFVGGWLCEISTLPGLNGICASMSQGWAYGGQTGHAEILTADRYTTIGCANFDGIWGCDLGTD